MARTVVVDTVQEALQELQNASGSPAAQDRQVEIVFRNAPIFVQTLTANPTTDDRDASSTQGNGQGSLDPSAAQRPPLHVLVIGIDEYQSPTIRNLRGAVADADAMTEYLHTDLRVPDSQIVILHNQEATRAKILDAFSAFHNRAAKNDAILIFYAGHGSSGKAPDGWTSESEDISFLVPYDSEMPDGDDRIHDIPDRTIGALLRDLSNDDTGLGNNITVIFDCCHSGNGTRAGAVDGSHVERGFKLNYTIPASLDQSRLDELPDKRATTAVKGFANTGADSHVLLAACSPSQTAGEGLLEGSRTVRGLFTRGLISTLRIATIDKITYRDVIDRIPEMKSQTPQCEGHDVDRVIFKALVPSKGRSLYPVSLAEDSLYVIRAGSALGICKGALFSIYPTQESIAESDALATMVATTIEPFISKLSFTASSRHKTLSITTSSPVYAFQTFMGTIDALQLHIPAKQELVPVIRALAMELVLSDEESPVITLAEGAADAVLSTRLTVDGEVEYFVKPQQLLPTTKLEVPLVKRVWHAASRCFSTRPTADGVRPVDFVLPAMRRLFYTTKLDVPLIQRVLRAATHFFWHLHRTSSGKDLQHLISVEMHEVGENTTAKRDRSLRFPIEKRGENLCRNGAVNVVADGSSVYGIQVHNDFNVPLHIWAFYFDYSDLSITEYFRPAAIGRRPEPSLPANATTTLGYGSKGGNPFRYYLREGQNEDVGCIKVFVSTEYVDLSNVKQSSPFGSRSQKPTANESKSPETHSKAGRAVRGDASRETLGRDEDTPALWDTLAIVVKQSRA